jgi:CheY-like chemotaxis protein
VIDNSDFNHISSHSISTIHICAIKQDLSESCIDTIKQLSWHYHQFDDLLAFDKAFHNKNNIFNRLSESKVVLLISENVLSENKANVDVIGENLEQHIDLIGLCQPTMRELSSKTSQQLDAMKLPYILLDTPLYRYSLEKIAKVLLYAPDEKNRLILSKKHDSSKESIPFINVVEENKQNLSNINVLLVEDNLVNQLVAKELLMSMKAKVIIAENGHKALESLGEHTFDVVLMDIQMPVMDGLTATKEIRNQEKYQYLPIIAMTALAREEDKQRSLAAGMNLHIAKPVTAELLLSSILQALKLETT